MSTVVFILTFFFSDSFEWHTEVWLSFQMIFVKYNRRIVSKALDSLFLFHYFLPYMHKLNWNNIPETSQNNYFIILMSENYKLLNRTQFLMPQRAGR